MNASYIIDQFNLNLEKPESASFVSFSQWSNFAKCPLYWKLNYIDKLKVKEPSIHTVFGTCMHNIIQHYIQVMYTSTIKKADEIDFRSLLIEELKVNYAMEVEKFGRHFSNKSELSEFFLDGMEILSYLRKKRKVYFSPKHEELIGTEIPLMICPDPKKPGVMLQGFLDLVFRDKNTGKIRIKDFKTSTKGWSKWDKADEVKVSQLLLYKMFFAKQYNVPVEKVEVEFIILKRKIDEDSVYPQRRIQLFSPAQGSVSLNKTQRNFQHFLDACFLSDGTFNPMFHFTATAGTNGKNCKFCEFKDRDDLCPKSERVY